MILKTVYS